MKSCSYSKRFGILFLLILGLMFVPRVSDAKQVSLLIIDADSYLVNEAIKTLKPLPSIHVAFYTYEDLIHHPSLGKSLNKSDVLIVDVMDSRLSQYVAKHVNMKKVPVFALRGARDNGALKRQGFRFDQGIQVYFANLTPENIRNMIYKVIHKTLDPSVSYQPPVVLPPKGIYHPQASRIFQTFRDYLDWYWKQGHFKAGAPWIGVTIFKSSLGMGQDRPVRVIVNKLEENGFNVIVAFGKAEDTLKYFLDHNGKSRVNLILAFSMKFQSSLNTSVKRLLNRLDVPVFNAISLYSQTIPAWRRSPKGIPPLDVVWSIANPEMSGQIEPTPLSGKVKRMDKKTHREFYVGRVISDNLDTLIARMKSWVRLQRMPNRQKRVAILFYNHNQGKQNIGASYLNVFKSIQVILKRMRKEGYQIPGKYNLTAKEIRGLILSYARNIGSWAPGELDKLTRNGEVTEIPMSTYERWFKRLPKVFREGVIRQWGPVEKSRIMIHEGKFVVPSVILGNIVLLPEPARGWGDDPMKLYHSPTLYPHHQYVAVYLWLKYGFKADAMIHLGTHATHEWLPGKQAGLASSDPPEVLITDIPNIYPYIVDDVGEGIEAKRRGRGVIIDHMIPALVSSGLYREYSRLYDEIEAYHRLKAMGSRVAPVKLKDIKNAVMQLGLDKDLGLKVLDSDALEKVEHYMISLKETMIPYGLHTFGVSLKGKPLQSTAKEIASQNSRVSIQKLERGLMRCGPLEINRLIHALNGGFIPAGEGNDPVRNPDAIPTGRDFYGFDPQKIPSREAWRLGKRAAERIIRESLEQKGTYPQKVAIILWATETIRNEGINEGTILYLLGLRPVWDRSGRVQGTRVIPGSVLKRPRIDVLVNPSGLYRDLFPNLILFIDRAIRKAMTVKDVENLIAEHSQRIEEALIKGGMSPEKAKRLSMIRIFSEKPGGYGTGVAETAKLSGGWKSDNEVAEVYNNHEGFAYGQGLWGVPAKGAFKENLMGVDTVVHSMSSSIYGTMDTDDVFQYVGGLSLSVKKASGKTPRTFFSISRSGNNLKVQTAERVIGQELRTRYLNPKWIKGMEKEGYAGAREMSNFLENMWGWQVTIPRTVGATKWKQVYEVYVKDKYDLHIKEFMEKNNPWAYQSMTARMLEAVRKGYWKASDKIVKDLSLQYAVGVVDKGVACCDHTCNNPFLNQMVVGFLSLPGVTTPKLVEQFKIAIEKMAKCSLANQAKRRLKLQRHLTQGFRESSKPIPKNAKYVHGGAVSRAAKGKSAQEVEGYKMVEIKRKDTVTEVSSSGVQWALSFFVLLIVGMFFYGVHRRR